MKLSASFYLAMGQAVNLANSLKKFPQKCMLADRKSAYYATFSAKSLEDALQYEFENARHILSLVSISISVLISCSSLTLEILCRNRSVGHRDLWKVSVITADLTCTIRKK